MLLRDLHNEWDSVSETRLMMLMGNKRQQWVLNLFCANDLQLGGDYDRIMMAEVK